MATAKSPASRPARPVTPAPYPPAAFDFVRRGLGHTVSRIHQHDPAEADRNVSGQQLCLGLRDLALDLWGGMALAVLASWGIRRTEDFGRIVYDMVRTRQLSTSTRDTEADFCGVYDFEEAFGASAVADRMCRDRGASKPSAGAAKPGAEPPLPF